jgi:hypothetical protein
MTISPDQTGEPEVQDPIQGRQYAQFVIASIMSGEIPADQLGRVAEACKRRQAMESLLLQAGDRIQVNDDVSPRHIAGCTGTVVCHRGGRIHCKLDEDGDYRHRSTWRMTPGSIRKVENGVRSYES